ncbi:MAG: hypothetical protein PWP52_1239 [Bacteroidales bacterium]|nr:hypothetical protein [Bacteroidales bacterium]
MLLKNKGLNLLHAIDGKETIEIFKKRKDIDLILMDIKMPVLNGIEAIKLIRQLNPDIPIIAQTAYAMQEDKELILQSGCNNYLSKPIKTNELINMLNQYL